MLSLIGAILIAGNIIIAQPMADYGSKNEEIGRLPEIVITATRYEGEDMAYSGMLPEIVITAPRGPEIGMLDEVVITETRYEGEDIAYSGMLPETIVTAKRDRIAQPVLTLVRLVRQEMHLRITNFMIISRFDFRNTGYLN
ncbi:MAG: hypothetical protein WBB37_06870 [bacterium]